MVAEAIGGWFANSLSLLADAGHMLTDVAAMVLALVAFWFAAKPATAQKTYGYYRLEILAALINGVVLVLISVWIVVEAIERWSSPQEIKGRELLIVATGGLVINIIAAYLLHAGHQKNDLNMRAAFLHVIGDLLGSVTAILAGILILAFGWLWADAAGSILISAIIVFGAWRLILESVNVLLEGTPSHINLTSVEESITSTQGVTGFHDLHVWTISSGIDALSVHIKLSPSVDHSLLLNNIREKLHSNFGIDHLTIQMETEDSFTEIDCGTGTKCFETGTKPRQYLS